MKPDKSEAGATADLAAIAAATQGSAGINALASSSAASMPSESDAAREAKIAELKAQFQAGHLSVDDKALAAKIVDSLKQQNG